MRKLILLVLLACLSLAPLAARAAESPATKPAGDETPLRFAFITGCKDSPFYEPVKKGMRDAAAKMKLAGFDLSPEILQLVKAGCIRCTVDQQPCIQGFYPVVQLAHYLRYGICPSNIDAGATIVDRANVDRVIELTKKKYR